MYGNLDDFEQQRAALMSHLRVWSSDEDALLVLGYISYFSGDVYTAGKVFERLRASYSQEMAHAADLFMTSIEEIKKKLVEQGKLDEFLPDDGRTLEQILQQ
jgi:hypothetical protein